MGNTNQLVNKAVDLAASKVKNNVDAYELGRQHGSSADPGQRKTTAQGEDPGIPKKLDLIRSYNKGYYDGAKEPN
jgi:hypothetical protein